MNADNVAGWATDTAADIGGFVWQVAEGWSTTAQLIAVGLLVAAGVIVYGETVQAAGRRKVRVDKGAPKLGRGRMGAARSQLYQIAVGAFKLQQPKTRQQMLGHGRRTVQVYGKIDKGVPRRVVAWHPVTVSTHEGAAARKAWESTLASNFATPEGYEWAHRWPTGKPCVESTLQVARQADEVRAGGGAAEKTKAAAAAVKVTRDGSGIATVETRLPRTFQIAKHDHRIAVQTAFTAAVASPKGAWRHEWHPKQDLYRATAAAPLPRSVPFPLTIDRIGDIAKIARTGKIPWAVTHDGAPVVWDAADDTQVHALLAGPTGSGKSTTARAMAAAWWLGGHDLLVIDPKRSDDWVWCWDLPGANVVYDPDAAVDALRGAVQVAVDRSEQQQQARWKRRGQPDFRRLLVYVDELRTLQLVAPDAAAEIGTLAAMGRNARVHLMLATQRPSAGVLDGDTKSNLVYRVGLGRLDGIAARIVFSQAKPGDEQDVDLDDAVDVKAPPGWGWAGQVGAQLAELQTLWLDLDDAADRLQPLREAAYQASRRHDRHTRPDNDRDADGGGATVEVVHTERTRDPILLPAGAPARKSDRPRGGRRHRRAW